MAFQAGAIVSKLSLDRSRFSASIKAVQKQTRTLGGWVKKNSGQFKMMGVAIAAMGAAALLTFKKMVKQYVEVGDLVHKMALRTGFAAETLSELAYAADISGADLTMLEKGVKKMSKTIVDASYGLETYLRVFRSLGLEIEDLLDMSPEQQFLKLGNAIAEMESDTLRTAAAVDIFGRAGTMLLPMFKEGAEGIATLREEAHRLGIIFDEEAAAKAAALKDAQTALKGSVQGLSIAILTDLIPVITEVTKDFTDWFVESREGAKTWANAFINFFKIIVNGIEGLMLAFGSFKVFAFELGNTIIKHLAQLTAGVVIITGYTKKLGVLGKTHEAAKDALKDLITIGVSYDQEVDNQIEGLAKIIDWFDNLTASLDKVKIKTEGAKKETKSFAATIEGEVLPPARDLTGVLEKAVSEFKGVGFEGKKAAEEIGKSWRETFYRIVHDASLFTYQLGSLFDQLSENQMAKIDSEYEARKKAIEKSLMSEEKKTKAIEKLEAGIEKKRKAAARSAAARSKAVALLESLVNTASAIVEALPNIPLAIAVGIMGAVQTAFIAGQSLPSFQRGGRIEGAGIVGERGPELFLPERPGFIVPARETRAALGRSISISISQVNYISAMDALGVRDFMRERGGPELLEMLKNKILLPEFQEALGT